MRNLIRMFALLFLTGLLFVFSCKDSRSRKPGGGKNDSISNSEIQVNEKDTNRFLDSEYKFMAYHNARFGYCLNYPSALLLPQGESENGDGQIFLSKDFKFSLTVSGMYNSEGLDITGNYQKDLNFYSGNNNYRLTFYEQKDNYYILSGLKGKTFFYIKTYLIKDKIYSVYAEYPAENNQLYAALLKEVLKTFPQCR